MRRHIPIAVLLAALAACGPSSQTQQLKEAVLAEHGRAEEAASVAFRFAGQQGGDVRLYQVPGLEEVAWRFATRNLVASRIAGFARDGDQVYLLSPVDQLIALELDAGRARVADSGVVLATLDPVGVLRYARRDSTVSSLRGRKSTVLADSLPGEIEGIWGATGGRTVLAVTDDSGRALVTLRSGQQPTRRSIPPGMLAVGPWGDVAAIGLDTALAVWDLERDAPASTVPLAAGVTALVFSASAHRIFVATNTSEILVIERFGLDIVGQFELPASAQELRVGPLGRVLLARPMASDSVVILNLLGDTSRIVLAGSWDEDLPAMALDGTVLLRDGNDVVAVSTPQGREVGRVTNGAGDRWFLAAWDPRRPALELAREAARAQGSREEGRLYVQVSSTTNPEWAEVLASDLRVAGVGARVLPPTLDDETYRVVIGPYATREQAEAIGRTLRMPYWIFTAPGEPE